MEQKPLYRLSPLIITMALGLILTVTYIKKHTSDSDQRIEMQSNDPEIQARNEFMMWQSLSRHLLSIAK